MSKRSKSKEKKLVEAAHDAAYDEFFKNTVVNTDTFLIMQQLLEETILEKGAEILYNKYL